VPCQSKPLTHSLRGRSGSKRVNEPAGHTASMQAINRAIAEVDAHHAMHENTGRASSPCLESRAEPIYWSAPTNHRPPLHR
jgi:hypothetical protein